MIPETIKEHFRNARKQGRAVFGFISYRSIPPLLCMLAFNFIVYNGTRIFNTDMPHYNLTIALDEKVPFVPQLIWVYLLAFLQWVIGYTAIGREGRPHMNRVYAGEMIAKFLTLILFLVLPTTYVRPPMKGNGLSSSLLSWIWKIDPPDNCFPSVHCLESWICFRGTFGAKQMSLSYRIGMLLFTLLVFATTVMVRQHTLLDIPGGVLCAEIGLFLSKKWRAGRLFDRLHTLLYHMIYE